MSEELETSPWGDFEKEYNFVRFMRQNTYQQISDPIFFKWQRGEATEQDWLDSINAINEANPYPEVTE
jgi:hypothetical protein